MAQTVTGPSTEKSCALVEVRALPAQAVAAVEIATQLDSRGTNVVFVAERTSSWFRSLYPDIASKTIILSRKSMTRVDVVAAAFRAILSTGRFLALCIIRREVNPSFFRLRGVPVGDLIADSAIRELGAGAARRRVLKALVRHSVFAAHALGKIWALSTAHGGTMIVSSSRSYAGLHGLLTRFGHSNGIDVLNNAPAFLAFTTMDNGIFHPRQEPRRDVKEFIEAARADSHMRGRIHDFIATRFTGSSPNSDFQRAYFQREEIFSKDGVFANSVSLAESVGRKPVIYIAPHVFADAVFMEGHQIFRTYLRWYIATIKIIQSIEGALWLTKPHPASVDYGEEGLVSSLLKRHDKHSKIYALPMATSHSDIVDACDAVVTVRGTVGLEFAIHGKPSVLAGNASYSHLGFSLSPATKSEYKVVLEGVALGQRIPVDSFAASAALYFLERHLIESNLPGSAFSTGANGKDSSAYPSIAEGLEFARASGHDPYSKKVSNVLDGPRAYLSE